MAPTAINRAGALHFPLLETSEHFSYSSTAECIPATEVRVVNGCNGLFRSDYVIGCGGSFKQLLPLTTTAWSLVCQSNFFEMCKQVWLARRPWWHEEQNRDHTPPSPIRRVGNQCNLGFDFPKLSYKRQQSATRRAEWQKLDRRKSDETAEVVAVHSLNYSTVGTCKLCS